MIGRTHRFHGHNALNDVYRRGRTVRASLMSLRIAARDSKKPYRVAVVVSRKVNKSAVIRNRIRRRIYAVVRKTATEVKPGTDLVFTVFSDKVGEVPADELQGIVAGLLGKAA